jgi:hypothetical protein
VKEPEPFNRQTPASAGALFSSSLREPPNEEPTYLLAVIDAGLKLSPAWEAEAAWQGALATTGAPNVWEPS